MTLAGATWMFETARLIQRGAVGTAITHLVATVGFGIAPAGVGLMVGVSLGRLG